MWWGDQQRERLYAMRAGEDDRAGSRLSSPMPLSRDLQQVPEPLGLSFLLCERGTVAVPTSRDEQHRAVRQAELLSPSILAPLTRRVCRGQPRCCRVHPPATTATLFQQETACLPAQLWEQVTCSGKNKSHTLAAGRHRDVGASVAAQNPSPSRLTAAAGLEEGRDRGEHVTCGGRSLGY